MEGDHPWQRQPSRVPSQIQMHLSADASAGASPASGSGAAMRPDTSRGGVDLIGVEKRFQDVQAVAHLDLEVKPGEFMSILGPSGSGKTTTMRIIGGFEHPDAGSVLIGGRDVTWVRPNQRDVNTVFQSYALFPHMTVQRNVEYGLELQRIPRLRRRETAMNWLKVVGLEQFAEFWPKELSGGMKKRCQIAVVLANPKPEEMAGLDPVFRPFRSFLHELRQKGWIEGKTIVIERHTLTGGSKSATGIVAEIIARKVDVIVLSGVRSLHEAALQATKSIPVVTLFPDDPVASGLIASLARPGGNLTGLTSTTGPDFYSKCIQLLQEAAPSIKRIAFIGSREAAKQFAKAIQDEFPQIGTLTRIDVTGRNGLGQWGGRATEVRLTGTNGTAVTDGDMVNFLLGLGTDWFEVTSIR